MSHESSFFNLNPEGVLKFVESYGFTTTGRFMQLNSYENRVFDIFLEASPEAQKYQERVVAKFYRPHRWPHASINDEHLFLNELHASEVPVLPAIASPRGRTLEDVDGIWACLFPRKVGRMPQEFLEGDLERVGRLLAQLHNIGAQQKAKHRPTFGSDDHPGWSALEILDGWIAPEVSQRYITAAETILDYLEDYLIPKNFIRIHGDCHRGNLLSDGNKFFFVDFDDFLNGPPIQDFWMLLSGDPETASQEMDQLVKGYESLREFDDREIQLIPALRGFRILSYAAWIAQRWADPSFPRLFPNFNSYLYWVEEAEALEKIAWSLR